MELRKLFLTALMILLSSSAWATTATFQEGVSSYAGTQDAAILSSSTNEHVTDSGTKTRTSTGQVYILQFDVSSIPTTATVSSATVQVFMAEQNCTAETVEVHSIANPDSSNGFPSNSSSADVFNSYATWRYKNESGTVKWSTAGGSANFTDVNGNAAESTVASGSCPGSVSKTLTVTSMVQSWVTTPASNSGMWFGIQDGSGNVVFLNKRDATSSNRPLLTVNYTDAGGGSTAGNVYSNMVIQGGFVNK